VDYGRNLNDAQWVTKDTVETIDHYVFGRLDQTTIGVSARVNYTITPQLSLPLYASPFLSAGGCANFRELVNGRAAHYEDRYAPYAYTGDPDFNYRSFRTTNVLRWEYRPGSTLFVVWQQGRENTTSQGDFEFGRDFGNTFGSPATNVFLVKISRWFSF
jgi:hypothetical protein